MTKLQKILKKYKHYAQNIKLVLQKLYKYLINKIRYLFCYWIKCIKFAMMKLTVLYCHFDNRREEKSLYAIL